MRKEQRNSFLRRLGIQRLTSPLSTSNYPKKTVLSEEMVVLWHSFIKSNQSGYIRKQFKDIAEQNFNVAQAWLSFLDNNHIPHRFDCYNTCLHDVRATVMDEYSAILSNLKSYRIFPSFVIRDYELDIQFPVQNLDQRKMNLRGQPDVRTLLLLKPAKKTTINLKSSGTKIRSNSVDSLMESKLQGYLYKDRGEFLKYTRPMNIDRLFAINEYQWFYKKDSGLRFRHNGDTIAVMYMHKYPAVVPVQHGTSLDQDFYQVINKVIRGLL